MRPRGQVALDGRFARLRQAGMRLSSLCVYCGAAAGRDPTIAADAERFGRLMTEAGVRLVYGGGSVGLMGILARSVLRHGGLVTGVIPQFLKDRELMLTQVSEFIITADMHERKRIMFDRSDAFLALPGGIGTLEETVEMMTWAQLGQHTKPILLANLNGFWNPLVALFAHMDKEGFVHEPPRPGRLYDVADSVEAILPAIERLLADQGPAKAAAKSSAELM